MIVILLVWVFIFVSSFSFGLITRRVLGVLTGGVAPLSIAFTSVTGLATQVVLLSYCSLFMPISNIGLLVGGTAVTLAATWYFRSSFASVWETIKTTWQTTDLLHKLFIAIFFLFILIKASGQVQSLDSGSYHLPFIKWVEQHKLITGLGNVHSRFGFNYHYHILYAFYGLAGVFGTTIHGLNGYLFLIGFVYLFGMYAKPGLHVFHKVAAILAMLYISQINKGMTGFSPDFPVAIVQMIIVFECLRNLTARQQQAESKADENYFLLSIFWLTFGAITLKLATVSVMFVVLIVFARRLFRPQIFLSLVVFAGLVFFPYFFRNYTISGYLVYPFYSVDIFNVPWKIPMARTVDEKIVIKNFALGYPYYYKGAYNYNLELFKTWIKNLAYLNKAYPPIIAIIAFCLMATVIKWIWQVVRKGAAGLKSPANIILFGLAAGILFWFYNAPDPRFGNGIILPFIAIVLGEMFISAGLTRWVKPMATVAMVAVIASSILSLSGMALSQTVYQTNNVSISLLLQEKYPAPDTTSKTVDQYHTWLSKERCWECPLPCSYTYDSFHLAEPGNMEKGFLPWR